MTIAFFIILLLNCMVIFAVDALLPAPAATVNTTVIVVNGTTVPSSLSDVQLLALTSGSGSNRTELLAAYHAADSGNRYGESHRPVVARKGVIADAGPTDEDIRIASTGATPTNLTATAIDKTPTALQTTTVAINTTTTADGHRPRLDTSITSAAKSPSPAAIVSPSSSAPLATATSTQSSSIPKSTTLRPAATAPNATTTPKPPTKPKITVSVDELPPVPAHKAATFKPSASAALPADTAAAAIVDEYEAPRLEPSRELRLDDDAERNAAGRYVIPIVTLIFAVPMIIGVGIVLTRRFRYYWSTRHYRRMDFLVDGMYNS